MPRLAKDMTGQRFGTLVVHSREGTDEHGRATWFCHCDCGGCASVTGNNLRSGNTRTCGRTCDLRGLESRLREERRNDLDL